MAGEQAGGDGAGDTDQRADVVVELQVDGAFDEAAVLGQPLDGSGVVAGVEAAGLEDGL
ncbi:hypothetical protein [Streptomyces sp. NRRL F-5123]|uniref:hypothetical protein n=1 Tax=Streptomyces sp. NRRL F-5123 TaxID=1463856 RepID=UPI00131CF5A6|nr:hypothetical protein [Streptomyces sp. NRRL F-5123]